jgi:hypothetical protein
MNRPIEIIFRFQRTEQHGARNGSILWFLYRDAPRSMQPGFLVRARKMSAGGSSDALGVSLREEPVPDVATGRNYVTVTNLRRGDPRRTRPLVTVRSFATALCVTRSEERIGEVL